MKKWRIRFEHPWSEDVKKYGAPIRIYLRTPFGFWMLGEKSQVYDRKNKKYTNRWAYLTYRPPL